MKPKFRSAFLLAAVLGNLLCCARSQAAPPIRYAGGDGSSEKRAVVIKGGNEETGVRAEYSYLAKHYPGYAPGGQAVVAKEKHVYDRLDFTTARGGKRVIFFDITGFYGKLD